MCVALATVSCTAPAVEVRGACGAVSLSERHRHTQRPTPHVDVLDDLIVRKPRRPALLIMQRYQRVIAGRTVQHQLHKKSELILARQLWPRLVTRRTHEPACPPMTLTLRNRAWEAAWVIQPDWAG